ncbi:hypothetical protein BKA00_007464 [Actinomadura coerulea]|uniref:Uncharacterized protein n=1 Tax=Actinomadura coerulea TaxID=46159 RepID=A0A7X0G6S9_9ACTN|nr:hypothetical protein [Actinomadura coerulea]GGQ08055.1 hypothetical protein GCM10010187_25190 [Actinomadura coerulea]
MAHGQDITARPEALVSVAMATWEEAWCELGLPQRIGWILFAVVDEETRKLVLWHPARPVKAALTEAWQAAQPIMRDHMRKYGYLDDQINRATAKASQHLSVLVAEWDSPPQPEPQPRRSLPCP